MRFDPTGVRRPDHDSVSRFSVLRLGNIYWDDSSTEGNKKAGVSFRSEAPVLERELDE
jgi:hypothetical protein